MQLDQTHVAVRVRSLSEIGDLALVLLHRYPATILVGFLLGAWPWMVANALLLYWIPLTESEFGLDDSEAATELLRYAGWMALLVFLQAPAAGVVTTIYLGQAVFEQKPTWKSAMAIARHQFGRWFWCLGVVRLAIPAMVFLAFRIGQPVNAFLDVFVPLTIFAVALLTRASKPFLPEMILLERCPIRSKDENEITLRRRSRALHRPIGSDVGSRWIAVALTFLVIFAGLFYSLVWARGITTGYWNIGLTTLLFLFPLALWTIAGLSVIVRMINYLDTRIRLEGWDVELAVRAEAMRQFGSDSLETPHPSAARTTSDPNAASLKEQSKLVGKSDGRGVTKALGIAFVIASTVWSPVSTRAEDSIASANTSASDIESPLTIRESLSSAPWYNSEEGSVRPIQVTPRIDDTEHRDSRWRPKPKALKRKAATSAPTTTAGGATGTGLFGTNFTLGNFFGWALLISTVMILVGMIVYAVSRAELGLEHKSKSGKGNKRKNALPDEQMLERIKHLPPELRRTDVNLRTECERLMKEGQFEQAIILLLGHQLLLLDQNGLLRLARGKTNGRYVRETRSSDENCGRWLRETADAFEQSYFGRHDIPADAFRQLWHHNDSLENAVTHFGAVQ